MEPNRDSPSKSHQPVPVIQSQISPQLCQLSYRQTDRQTDDVNT